MRPGGKKGAGCWVKVCRSMSVCRFGNQSKIQNGHEEKKILKQLCSKVCLLKDSSFCEIKKMVYQFSRSIHYHTIPANQSLSCFIFTFIEGQMSWI